MLYEYNIINFLSIVGSLIGAIIVGIGIFLYISNQNKNNPHINSIANTILGSGLLLIGISTTIHIGVLYA
ncbi:MAG: hypothetical protein ACP5RI_03085 [Candidatus Micrarchaeia archaeon]